MSRRGKFIQWGGFLSALLFFALVFYSVASQTAPAIPRPPELRGQQVPAKVYQIPFDRRYDLDCSFYGDQPTTYLNGKILGFTGHGEESPGSGGFSSSSRTYFDVRLVLELADGRLASIPPRGSEIHRASVD